MNIKHWWHLIDWHLFEESLLPSTKIQHTEIAKKESHLEYTLQDAYLGRTPNTPLNDATRDIVTQNKQTENK